MTLSRKIVLSLALLVTLVLLFGAAAVWGLLGLQQNLGEALDEYDQLREIYDVRTPITEARATIQTPVPNAASAAEYLRAARLRLDSLEMQYDAVTLSMFAESRLQLDDIITSLESDVPIQMDAQRIEIVAALNDLLATIDNMSTRTRTEITRLQSESRHRLYITTVVAASLAAVTLLAAIAIAFGQYRGVIQPVRRLQSASQRLAEGDFDTRLDDSGRDELAALAAQFNSMADELSALYREMEQRIERASRELVRTERLASVGYLAAGVAHEINNPLGIISGHAELAQRRLARDNDTATLADTLTVISEEAFRCKRITDKLLEMSRGGTDTRKPVDLVALAQQTRDLVADLPVAADRTVTHTPSPVPLAIDADEAQLKQVLLNLITNALQATSGGGTVTVSTRQIDDTIVLEVADDGVGMDSDTAEHVFEPFFTRRRTGEPGTGLGLSITHAIVTDHAGRISAASDGPGTGSRFTIEFPIHRG